jgi:hypothetical protein
MGQAPARRRYMSAAQYFAANDRSVDLRMPLNPMRFAQKGAGIERKICTNEPNFPPRR